MQLQKVLLKIARKKTKLLQRLNYLSSFSYSHSTHIVYCCCVLRQGFVVALVLDLVRNSYVVRDSLGPIPSDMETVAVDEAREEVEVAV